MPSRRDFLKGAALGSTTLLLAACGGTAAPPAAPAATTPAKAPAASGATAPAAGKPGTGTGAVASGTPSMGGTLRIGLNSDLTTMDPHLSTAAVDRQVYQSIYDPLVSLKPDLTLAPGLAEKWEISPDGKTYTFTLRKGVKFHDGEPFDATAAKFNFDRMRTHPKSLRKGELADVTAADVVDEGTVKLTLKQPSSPLLALLTDRAGMMVSPKAAEASGDDFARKPVGTGPFSFVEWVKDDRLTVKKFAGYWGKDSSGGSLPYLDEVTYRPVLDVNIRLTSLKTNTLDLIDQVPPKDAASLRSGQDPVLSEVPGLAFEYFDLQHTKPPFDKKEARQAVISALDQEPIIRSVFFGIGQPANGTIPPSSWAYQKDYQPFQRDLARAKSLAGSGFTFTVLVTNTPVQKQVAEVYKQQLAEAGITMNIELLEFGTLLSRINAKDYQAVILQWSGRPDPDGNIYNYYSTKGAQNRSGYANPAMDDLLDKARATADQKERAALYADAEKLAFADSRWFLLRFVTEQKAFNPKVGGFTHVPDGMIRTSGMWIKK